MTEQTTDTGTGETPAQRENVLLYPIPGTKGEDGNAVQMSIDLTTIPANVRLDFLRAKVSDYVRNSVNQAQVRHEKALEPWVSYENAVAADPLQTAVAKPEGERPTVDLIAVATAARDRLYKGEVRKQGERKEGKKADPLDKLVTDAVVREVFDNAKKANDKAKWTDAVKAVADAGGGIAYLNAKIDALVAAGQNRGALEKFRDTRYVNPARMMLGQTETKATKDMNLLG